ncbi:MAG: OFA family MFS transporter [Bacillota bacterium]|nr:OFA family MFS transporter [Bacillota bacterium]
MGVQAARTRTASRWWQVVFAILVMLMISVYEYTFTLFQAPLQRSMGSSLSLIGLTYTFYVLVQALGQIPGGALMDRIGPRWVMTVAAFFAGLGWIFSSLAHQIWQLWLAYGIGSIGPAIVYACAMSIALKWFPEPRMKGLVSGLNAAGFGAGSAIFIPVVASLISSSPDGWRTAFLWFGVAQLVVILVLAQVLRYPPAGWAPEGWEPGRQAHAGRAPESTTRQWTPGEMLRTWQFYALWISFAFTAAAGLMIAGNLAAIGKSSGFQEAAGLTVLAITLSRITNGLGRIFAGWVSDRIGRPLTMGIFYLLMGVTLFVLRMTGSVPAAFLLLSILFTFFWGPIFVLNPAAVGDYFGSEHSGINYGILYSAKAAGGVFAGFVAGALAARTGDWTLDLYLAGGMAVVAGLIAFTLKQPAAPAAAAQPMAPGAAQQGVTG